VHLNGTDQELSYFEGQDEVMSVEVLLEWFKQQRSDSVPVSGSLLMIIFVLPQFYM
jgi:hypothetical protein